MRRKTVSEIIASRLKDIRGRKTSLVEESRKEENEFGYVVSKMAAVLDKEQLDNQDKIFLLQHLEQKQRVCFGRNFPAANIKWVVARQKVTVDKNYDSSQTSLYLFRGKLSFYRVGSHSKEDFSLMDEIENNKQLLTIGKYQGMGVVFDQKILQKCVVIGQNIIALVLHHSPNDLKMIQRNCLLTSKEKQEVINRFSLFEDVDNFRKNFLPFFVAKKYNKSDIIYEIGEVSTSFYLIVEGEVEFFQANNKTTLISKQEVSPLQALRKKHNKRSSFFVSQKLCQGCCFGEQELINQSPRVHTARCLTASCVLLVVSKEVFQKLMRCDGFAERIRTLNDSNLRQKQSKMQTFAKMQQSPPPEPSQQVEQTYHLFKSKVLNRLEQSQKIPQPRKLSLRRSKHKIMHGHTLKIPRNHCATQQNESFSMLRVNQSMYLKTLKRFRHSLKEIEEQKKPKKKVEIGQARSLQKVWNVLGLKEMFSDSQDEEEEKEQQQKSNGRFFYQSHLKIKRTMKDSCGFRPKGLTTNCRLKRQYLDYLQNCI